MDLKDRLLRSPAVREFVEDVRQLVAECEPDIQVTEAALKTESEQLNQKCRGWLLSLSDPELTHSVRMAIQQEFDATDQRLKEIDVQLGQLVSNTERLGTHLTPESVVDRIVRLETTLNGGYASAVNLELAQHIESIRCKPSGEVTVKLCLLGTIADPSDLINVVSDSSSPRDATTTRRRRTKRNVACVYDDDEAAEAANNFAVDPNRFAELGPQWFTEHRFQVPERQSWAKQHAEEVARFRLEKKVTMDKTAKHFEVTVPTIRAALKIAQAEYGLNAFGKKLSNSNWNCWCRANAHLVDEFLHQPGATIKTAAKHFGKAEATISKAKRLASELRHSQEATVQGTSEAAEETEQE